MKILWQELSNDKRTGIPYVRKREETTESMKIFKKIMMKLTTITDFSPKRNAVGM